MSPHHHLTTRPALPHPSARPRPRSSFVIPIARAAGSLKRLDPEGSEEVILYRTMLDLIKPKLVYLDLPLFMALLSDLFPGVELPPADGGSLRRAIEAELRESNLQVSGQQGAEMAS
jgi:dynein heavy chain